MKSWHAEITEASKKDPRTYELIGAAMEVHGELGCGFLEAVYQEAYGIVLPERGVPYRREVDLPVFFKGRKLNTSYRSDFICYDSIIVELKAQSKLGKVDEAQIINYLKATGFTVGLLLNFGAESLEYRRFVLTKTKGRASSADFADFAD